MKTTIVFKLTNQLQDFFKEHSGQTVADYIKSIGDASCATNA